ncbi:MAG: penicillin-binding protein activator, partial [Gammaproteobacteria bacterium]
MTGARVPERMGAPVFTFTLAPDAESRRVAEQAMAEGYGGAAVLAPEGAWGDRMTSAFVERWQEIGGTLVAEQRYDANDPDFATPVRTLLQVESSELRAKDLRAIVRGYFAFQPNYRQDMDFIFMPAFPVEARLLKPHLSYFAASRVPVLATSHVYTGQPNAGEDLDLERIRFGDMPFILTPTSEESNRLDAIASTYGASPADYGRLLAFGADAFQLGMRVQALSVTPDATYSGRSGQLSVEPGNKVRRGLTWATFVDGTPLVDGQTRPDPEEGPAATDMAAASAIQ